MSTADIATSSTLLDHFCAYWPWNLPSESMSTLGITAYSGASSGFVGRDGARFFFCFVLACISWMPRLIDSPRCRRSETFCAMVANDEGCTGLAREALAA